MVGMDRNTGKALSGLQHLSQSIHLILNTPLKSRVMLPEFGSEVVDLIDAPMNAANQLRLYTATIAAVNRWEPRIRVTAVTLKSVDANGVIHITITGIYQGQPTTLETTIGGT